MTLTLTGEKNLLTIIGPNWGWNSYKINPPPPTPISALQGSLPALLCLRPQGTFLRLLCVSPSCLLYVRVEVPPSHRRAAADQALCGSPASRCPVKEGSTAPGSCSDFRKHQCIARELAAIQKHFVGERVPLSDVKGDSEMAWWNCSQWQTWHLPRSPALSCPHPHVRRGCGWRPVPPGSGTTRGLDLVYGFAFPSANEQTARPYDNRSWWQLLSPVCQGTYAGVMENLCIINGYMTSGFCRFMVVPSKTVTAKWFKIACWGFWIHRSCPACLPGRPIPRPKTLNHLSKKAYATLARFRQWPFLACKKKMKLDLLCIWLQVTGQNIASYVWTNNIIKPVQNFRGE